MLAVIYATIGSMANVSILRKTSLKICPNSYALNASMRVILKSCSVCVVSHMMRHSFIFAAISVKTGSMVDALAFCNAKRKTLMSTFVRIARRIVL